MKRNIGVVACVAYRPGQQINTLWGDNALRWLFDPRERFSIPSYFRDVTGGLIELNAQVYPTFFWESAELADVLDRMNRMEAAEKLWDTAHDQGIDLGMFDGAVFFTLGRPANVGAAVVNRDGIHSVALLSDEVTHACIAHEVGHVVGLDHPFLLSDERFDKHGEYGDPTCIMSAEGYGGRPVAFELAANSAAPVNPAASYPIDAAAVAASTIDPAARLWRLAGPGISAAAMWRFIPGFPGVPPWVRLISPNEAAVPVSLSIPAAESGTKAVVMPDLFGAGWYTAELRTATGWDRSFRTASAGDLDLAYSPGVVIHSIQDVGVAEDGKGWPKENRVCYEGTIPVPSTGNDDWTNLLFSVRVTGAEGSGLIVGRTLPPGEAVRLEVLALTPTTITTPGPAVESVLVGPSCGKGMLSTHIESTSYLITVIAAATGFLQPAFNFTLNDQPIGTWANIVDPSDRTDNALVRVRLERPVAYQEAITETADVLVMWRIRGNRLTISVPWWSGGRFVLQVGVAVGDATLPTPVARATASETFDLVTASIRLTDESREAVQQCARYLGQWKRGRAGRTPRPTAAHHPADRLDEA